MKDGLLFKGGFRGVGAWWLGVEVAVQYMYWWGFDGVCFACQILFRVEVAQSGVEGAVSNVFSCALWFADEAGLAALFPECDVAAWPTRLRSLRSLFDIREKTNIQ